jgi:hypothetical protein
MNPIALRGLVRGLLAGLCLTVIWLGWAIEYLTHTTNSNPLNHSHPKQCECIYST